MPLTRKATVCFFQTARMCFERETVPATGLHKPSHACIHSIGVMKKKYIYFSACSTVQTAEQALPRVSCHYSTETKVQSEASL